MRRSTVQGLPIQLVKPKYTFQPSCKFANNETACRSRARFKSATTLSITLLVIVLSVVLLRVAFFIVMLCVKVFECFAACCIFYCYAVCQFLIVMLCV